MDDSREDDKPQDAVEDPSITERRRQFTRRGLIRAGWVVPLVTTVNIPSAFAQSPVPSQHLDHTDHVDLPHTDAGHADTGGSHVDSVPHSDHSDSPHQDHQDHLDAHADSHVDSHVDTHGDTTPPHVDVPHVDSVSLRS